MKTYLFATAAALVFGTSAYAASQPIRVYPGQTIFACPKKAGKPPTPGVVCTQNIVVTGGNPHSGYTFFVKSGTTLPSGTFLLSLTGVVTAQSSNPSLPAGGRKTIAVTVSDGSKSASGNVTLEMERGQCGCSVLMGGFGALPDARANQPYAVALPVSGPPSNQVLRPNYKWKLKTGDHLPHGMVLDQARGVLRGTPLNSTSGHDYSFTVTITETHTGDSAFVPGPYTLHVQ